MDSPGFCDRTDGSSVMAINITASRIMFLVTFGKKTTPTHLPIEETCPFETTVNANAAGQTLTATCGYLCKVAALLARSVRLERMC